MFIFGSMVVQIVVLIKKTPSVAELVYIYPYTPHWPMCTPFEWDMAVLVVPEQNRERVLFDPTFKYIRDIIMRTITNDEDEEKEED